MNSWSTMVVAALALGTAAGCGTAAPQGPREAPRPEQAQADPHDDGPGDDGAAEGGADEDGLDGDGLDGDAIDEAVAGWEDHPDSGDCESDPDACGDAPEEERCLDYTDFTEAEAPQVAIVIAEAPLVGAPVHAVDCMGFLDASCLSPSPLMCGIDGTSVALVRDEGRIPLAVHATRAVSLTIGGQSVTLAAAGKAFVGRVDIDVRARMAEVESEPITREGFLDLAFVVDPGGPFEARGTLTLGGFGGVVRAALAGFERRPVALAGDPGPAAAGGVLLLDRETIVGAIPARLETTLGAVRHLARLVYADPDPALCDPDGRTRALAPTLEVYDRTTGQRVRELALPAMPAGQPCPIGVYTAGYRTWPLLAYADRIAPALAPLVPPSPWRGRAAAPTSGFPWRPLGLARPTVTALLAALGGDRVRLARVLGGGVPGLTVGLDGELVVELRIADRAAAAALTELGLDATLASLVGRPHAEAIARLGPPKVPPTGTSGTVVHVTTTGGVTGEAIVSLKLGAVDTLYLKYAPASP